MIRIWASSDEPFGLGGFGRFHGTLESFKTVHFLYAKWSKNVEICVFIRAKNVQFSGIVSKAA